MSAVRSVREMLRETIAFDIEVSQSRWIGRYAPQYIWPKPPRSADVAYYRASAIVALDRAAVPCGRWFGPFTRWGSAKLRCRWVRR